MSTALSMAAFAGHFHHPRAVNIVALSAGARYGLRASLRHVTGATVGFALLLLLIGLGMHELLARWRFSRAQSNGRAWPSCSTSPAASPRTMAASITGGGEYADEDLTVLFLDDPAVPDWARPRATAHCGEAPVRDRFEYVHHIVIPERR